MSLKSYFVRQKAIHENIDLTEFPYAVLVCGMWSGGYAGKGKPRNDG